MNGVKKDTFISIASDKKSAGLIYDALAEIHSAVYGQPTVCAKKFVKVRHVKIIGCVIIGSLIIGGIIRWEMGLKLIPFL
jgi:hypothetical protein